ncbi:TPA: hypothetical protein HA246_01540 [Candidatus Woesearchaeota archaeon]|nr:hypothetical protein [Candidatus Woesearchaeota archaeon]
MVEATELFDLHRHLEASIPPLDIARAAQRFDIQALKKDGRTLNVSEISDLVVMQLGEKGWDPFYDTVVQARKAFVSTDAIRYLTMAAFLQAGTETKYFEMRVSPLSLIKDYLTNTGRKAETETEYKLVATEILNAMVEGMNMARQILPEHEFGLRFGISRTPRDNSFQKLDWLIDLFEQLNYKDNFTGLDVLGLEVEGDLKAVVPYIKRFRAYLPDLAIHAGESIGPKGIYDALELNPNAIGHGIAAAKDPMLMHELASRGIYIENCPTSNARVIPHILAEYEQHPLRTLTDYRDSDGKRIKIVLGTDDPVSFGLTIAQEHEAARALGADIGYIKECARERFHHIMDKRAA